LNGLTDNTGRLSDEPDKEEEIGIKPEGKEAEVVAVERKANEKRKLIEDMCAGNLTQEVGVVNTIDTEQEAALRQFERERVEDSQKTATTCLS